MSLLPHFGYKKLVRHVVTGKPLLIGYDRTWGQRVAWGLAKILLHALVVFLAILALLWLWLA